MRHHMKGCADRDCDDAMPLQATAAAVVDPNLCNLCNLWLA
jgi:hypothetical protein